MTTETTDELWGGETSKAVANFPVSGERVPVAVVRWLGRIKGTAARVNDVAMLLASDTLIRRVRLALEFDGDRAPIHGDRVLLQQAVLNVIVNAIDAAADLRESERVVTVWTGPAGDNHARIRVRDQGRGLPPGSAHQVFEPFFSTKATGLGMGLAIARSIVESHGGTIQLESDSSGVVVTINLPVAELVA